MPDIATTTASICLFLKAHLPAVFGAIFSGERVPKDNMSAVAWIITWLAKNIFGIFIVIVMSVYIGGWIEAYRNMSNTEADAMRLMIGLFGLKLFRYFSSKIEPFFNDVLDVALEALRVKLNLGSKKGANDD